MFRQDTELVDSWYYRRELTTMMPVVFRTIIKIIGDCFQIVVFFSTFQMPSWGHHHATCYAGGS